MGAGNSGAKRHRVMTPRVLGRKTQPLGAVYAASATIFPPFFGSCAVTGAGEGAYKRSKSNA